MSDNYQQFQAFIAASFSNIKVSTAGVYIAKTRDKLLNNKRVVLVSQKNVRDIDLAVSELQKAHDAIASALAALQYFPDLNTVKMLEAKTITAEYKAVLVDVVEKAYQRRREAVGVVA